MHILHFTYVVFRKVLPFILKMLKTLSVEIKFQKKAFSTINLMLLKKTNIFKNKDKNNFIH